MLCQGKRKKPTTHIKQELKLLIRLRWSKGKSRRAGTIYSSSEIRSGCDLDELTLASKAAFSNSLL